MEIPNDPVVVAQMKRLADGCEFRDVKRYFRDPSSEIDAIILVQKDYRLEEIAALGTQPEEAEHQDLADEQLLEIWHALLDEGAIKMGVDDLNPVPASLTGQVVLLDDVPDHQWCEVICLPPVYVVKLYQDFLCEFHNYDRDEYGETLRMPEINCAACRGMGFFTATEIAEFLKKIS